MRAFAAELDDRFVFVDLRSPPVGMGFSWSVMGRGRRFDAMGTSGSRYAPPEKRPGRLGRLAGR